MVEPSPSCPDMRRKVATTVAVRSGTKASLAAMTLRGGIDVAFLVAGALTFIGWRANDYRVRWRRRPDPMPRAGRSPPCSRSSTSALPSTRLTSSADPPLLLPSDLEHACAGVTALRRRRKQERALTTIRHPATVSPWRWATRHSPSSRRYTWVARKV